jgi:uncharacterized protein DUF6932
MGKIERLRRAEESVDALIEVLTAALNPTMEGRLSQRFEPGVIPAFDPATGALPPGDHRATLEEIASRFGFTPRRRWLLKGLRTPVGAFWAAGNEDIFIDGSFYTREARSR